MKWIERLLMSEPTDPAELKEPYFLLCSGCYNPCCSDEAHVVPNWNHAAQDFLTTYRCGDCWIPTLRENRWIVLSLDEDMREKFCKFLERHGYTEGAELVRQVPLLQAVGHIEMFINAIESEQIKLSP